ncbi:MAG: cob(I)yrinic acid a,c-diamide adenosyltransferase, partial [Chloroflexaceae bacterium]|nr:cob(I)yrinic acid a,c-diamide adenosyltransferase [Chloroflexaceae bacterium]
MKIYTKTGDAGQTGLWGGQRVRKDVARVQAYGNVDELNAVLGVARAAGLPGNLDDSIIRIQNELFVVGADLASPGDSDRIPRVLPDYVTTLEQEIDQFESELEPLRQFILPGGTAAAAHLHLARTVCRRVERSIVTLATEEPINATIEPYMNRLS